MKRKIAQVFVMVLGLSAATAGAVSWDKPTDAEVAALPPYCMAKFRGVNVEQWERALGSIYEHVHHYCGALVYISRYYKTSNPQDRKFFMNNIINNLNYMTTHADQNSPLMPEIYFTKGRFLMYADKNAEGIEAFRHAIQLKPDYALPYDAIADFYTGIKNKQDALEILKEGLRQIPNSPTLKRRYHELGGKLPLPEVPPSEDRKAQTKSQAPVPAVTENTIVETAPLVAPQTSKPEEAPPDETPPQKIGTPSNPWCRFCPDVESAPAGK